MKTNRTQATTMTRKWPSRGARRAALVALVTARTCAPESAHADEPSALRPPSAPEDSWDARYEAAQAAFIAGRLREAAALFHALARTAKDEHDRVLAHEMARLASESADRAAEAAPPPPPPPARARAIRGSDELTLLYASSFLYGAGSGVWFLLATQPDSAITATIPFAAITAAPVLAIATIDHIKPLPRSLPHAISSGLYLGLGESIFVIGIQQARAIRFRDEGPSSDAKFRPETVAAVLWSGATLGATLGGALGAGLETTPGRVSFTASMTVWSGVLTGLAAGALLPDDEWRRERAFGIGLTGYNAGLWGGLLFAGTVAPSVARVRLGDLLAIAGGLVSTGTYLSIVRDVDVRAAEGIAAAGFAAGLATGWAATRGMVEDGTASSSPPPRASVQTGLVPVPAGAGLGVTGVF